jgi:hypothetical protein
LFVIAWILAKVYGIGFDTVSRKERECVILGNWKGVIVCSSHARKLPCHPANLLEVLGTIAPTCSFMREEAVADDPRMLASVPDDAPECANSAIPICYNSVKCVD